MKNLTVLEDDQRDTLFEVAPETGTYTGWLKIKKNLLVVEKLHFVQWTF